MPESRADLAGREAHAGGRGAPEKEKDQAARVQQPGEEPAGGGRGDEAGGEQPDQDRPAAESRCLFRFGHGLLSLSAAGKSSSQSEASPRRSAAPAGPESSGRSAGIRAGLLIEDGQDPVAQRAARSETLQQPPGDEHQDRKRGPGPLSEKPAPSLGRRPLPHGLGAETAEPIAHARRRIVGKVVREGALQQVVQSLVVWPFLAHGSVSLSIPLFPPPPGRRSASRSVKAVRARMTWMRTVASEQPMALGDLGIGLLLDQTEQRGRGLAPGQSGHRLEHGGSAGAGSPRALHPGRRPDPPHRAANPGLRGRGGDGSSARRRKPHRWTP